MSCTDAAQDDYEVLTEIGLGRGSSEQASEAEDVIEASGAEPVDELQDDADAVGAIGATCESNANCSTNEQCVDPPDGRCACRPGWVACGTTCRNIRTNPAHCGACGHQCASGSCDMGVCTPYTPPDFQVDPSITISGERSTFACRLSNEGGPTRSLSGNAFAPPSLVLNHQFKAGVGATLEDHYTWSTGAWNNWNIGMHPVGTFAGYEYRGDTWATSSAVTGLEYLVEMGDPPVINAQCFAIAGAPLANLINGDFSAPGFPLSCVEVPPAGVTVDGPSMVFDPGAKFLFGTYARFSAQGNGFGAYWFRDCSGGPPGSLSCPLTGSVSSAMGLVNHPAVAINPKTHHPIFARRNSNNTVSINIYNTKATLIKTFAVATIGSGGDAACNVIGGGQVPKCGSPTSTDCGAANTCMQTGTKISIATKYVDPPDNKAYAYLAWDTKCTFGDNKRKVSFAIVDITDELNPVNVTWFATGCFGGNTQFNASVSTNWFSKDVGWFYYNFTDPCQISFVGFGDDALALNNITGFGTLSGNTFPGMIAMAGGLGHYVVPVHGGLPGGWLMPTWSQPVVTSSTSCIPCQSQSWGLVTRAARVKP